MQVEIKCSSSKRVKGVSCRSPIGLGFSGWSPKYCAGEVGAVFCIEASRLARNGRDWHQSVELCGTAGAVLIDADALGDPIDGWRVCWIGGWDKFRVLFVVMVERPRRPR
jgi:hypothetical protein